MEHPHNIADTSSPVRMTTAADHLSFASGAYAWSVDIDTGELMESYDCFEWDENGEAVPLDNMFGGCALAVMTDDAVYLANAFDELLRYRTFEQSPGVLGYEARWRIPGFSTGETVLKRPRDLCQLCRVVWQVGSAMFAFDGSSCVG